MKRPRCVHCRKQMKITKVDKFNKPQGIALMSAGLLFLAAIPVEAILSVVLLPFGAVVAFSKKEVWFCPSCSSIVDRFAPGASFDPLDKLKKLMASENRSGEPHE